MSSENWSAEGYGVLFEYEKNYKFDSEKLVAFVKKHKPEVLKEILEDYGDTTQETIVEYLNNYEDQDTCETGVLAFVAYVIAEETKIRCSYYVSNVDGNSTLMLPVSYPWYFNETEKNITTEELDEILNKYMSELGIRYESCLKRENDGNVTGYSIYAPDFCHLEYFG